MHYKFEFVLKFYLKNNNRLLIQAFPYYVEIRILIIFIIYKFFVVIIMQIKEININ